MHACFKTRFTHLHICMLSCIVILGGRLGQYVDIRTFQDTTHTDILTDPRVVLAIVEIAEANRPQAPWTPMGPWHGWLASLGRAVGRLVDWVRGGAPGDRRAGVAGRATLQRARQGPCRAARRGCGAAESWGTRRLGGG